MFSEQFYKYKGNRSEYEKLRFLLINVYQNLEPPPL